MYLQQKPDKQKEELHVCMSSMFVVHVIHVCCVVWASGGTEKLKRHGNNRFCFVLSFYPL